VEGRKLKNGIGRRTKAQAAAHALDARKTAAVRDLIDEADDLAMDIIALVGGAAEVEGSAERLEIFKSVWRLPRYDHEARRRARRDTL
jgi:hypothetical protein